MGQIYTDQSHHFRCASHMNWESSCAGTSWTMPGNGWHEETYAFECGKGKFISASIAPGISITQSFGAFHHDYQATISYDFPVAILGFGIRGQNDYTIGRNPSAEALRAGDVILYRPEDAKVTRRTAAQRDCQSVGLKFDHERIIDLLDELRDLGDHTGHNAAYALRLGEKLPISKLLQPLINNPFANALDRLTAESAALSLLADCLRMPRDHDHPSGAQLSSHERKSLSRAVDLLLSDLTSPPDLYTLAAEAGMSHTRLNRCFKKAYGCTIFAWLRVYRLNLAQKMLREDRYSVTEIAFLCGFSSASHFGYAFRSQYGCTPMDFRQQPAA